MSCYNPVLAVDLGYNNPETGKKKIKLLPRDRVDYNLAVLRAKFGDSLLLLPCGKCIGCIKDYRSSWAVRILLEASLYEHNSFITLTYDNRHLPKDNKPHRDEIVKFFKRLRKAVDTPFRVFYCGEKGSAFGRAHYHAIIFGYDFPDKVKLMKSDSQNILYRSKTLEKCWTFGLSSIGEVDPGSACYVAQYSNKKKLTGKDDGSFVGMSRMPGLGVSKFDLKWFRSDTIYCALGEATIPRFFHKCLEALNPDYYLDWKQARKNRCSQRVGNQYLYGFRNEEEAMLYEEQYQLEKYIRRLKSQI